MHKSTLKIFIFLFLGCLVAEQVHYILTVEKMSIVQKEKKENSKNESDDGDEAELEFEKVIKHNVQPDLLSNVKITRSILADYAFGVFKSPDLAVFSPPPDLG